MKKNLSILLVSISFLPLFAASAGVSVSIDGEKGNKEKVEMVTVAEKKLGVLFGYSTTLSGRTGTDRRS